MTLADKLKRWRSKLDLTQKEAAEHLGVNLRSYEAWEGGRYEPDQKGPILKVIELTKN